jgi:hypothetical protein
MKNALRSSLLASFAVAIIADSADAKTPTVVYSSSGSCIASPFGFTAKLQPVNSGVSWRTTFNVVGSGDENGNVREVGQSVDSASFGVGPRMHMPAANAYTATYVSSVTGPNEDGSFTLRVGTQSGTFTAGPNVGLNFTISGLELRGWIGANNFGVYGSSGSPVVQAFTLSDGTKYERICTTLTVSTAPRP